MSKNDMLDIVLPYSKVDSPEDVSDMVEALVQLLATHLQKQKQKMPKPDNAAQQDSTQDSSNPENDSPDPGNPQSTKDQDNQPGESVHPIEQALNSTEEEQDMGSQLRNMALKAESQDTLRVAAPAKEQVIREFGYTEQEIKASTQLVSKLSANLRGLLQAQVLDHSKPGLSGNRIARNQVHKIRTGEPRLFLRRSPVKQINTAVHILLDNSSSMRNCNRFEIAKTTTMALLKSLSHVRGINLALSIFPAVYPYRLNGDSETVPVAQILRHERGHTRKLLYPHRAKGNTPLAPAVRLTASRLWGLPEHRKILMILTDGDPDSREEAKEAIKEAIDLNIEVVCLGIEDVAHPEIFPIYEIVNEVKALPSKAFCLFEKLLINNP